MVEQIADMGVTDCRYCGIAEIWHYSLKPGKTVVKILDDGSYIYFIYGATLPEMSIIKNLSQQLEFF